MIRNGFVLENEFEDGLILEGLKAHRDYWRSRYLDVSAKTDFLIKKDGNLIAIQLKWNGGIKSTVPIIEKIRNPLELRIIPVVLNVLGCNADYINVGKILSAIIANADRIKNQDKEYLYIKTSAPSWNCEICVKNRNENKEEDNDDYDEFETMCYG